MRVMLCLDDKDGMLFHQRRQSLFRWNRVYPADQYFDRSLLTCGWTLRETEEFPGFSHAKITKEVYKKCKQS